MLKAFTSGDYDRIDAAIRELEASDDPATWIAMLRDCLITKDGTLIASEELTVSGNRQPAADYGILELIGRIPKGLETNPTVKRRKIRSLQLHQYEGQSGVYWPMQKFPISIYKFTNLKILNLRSAELTALPAGISALIHLEELNLANNQLTHLPADIGNCSSLRLLDINTNRLKDLPKDLGGLNKLERLQINHNFLKYWPNTLASLASLEHLELSFNELAPTLPPEIGQLKKLKTLFLNGNSGLEQLPAELADLPCLEELRIERCPALKPIPNRRNLQSDELRQYLRKLRRSHGQTVPAPRKSSIPKSQISLFSGTHSNPDIKSTATAPLQQVSGTKSPLPSSSGTQTSAKPTFGIEKKPMHDMLENLLSYFRKGDKLLEAAGMQLLRTLDDDDLYRALFDRWNTALLADDNNNQWRRTFRHGYILSKRQVLTIIHQNDNAYLTSNFLLSKVSELSLGPEEIVIPGILESFSGLRCLKINAYNTALPVGIETMSNLAELDIHGIRQKKPLQFHQPAHLAKLQISNCQITAVQLKNCPSLKEFIVNYSRCSIIELDECPALESLKVKGENVESLKVSSECMLRNLELSHDATYKSLSLPSLRDLQTLVLSFHKSSALLEEAFKSPNLEKLCIENPTGWNDSQFLIGTCIPLPPPVSRRLHHVELINLGLREFPHWLFDQPSLFRLSLAHNRLQEIVSDWSRIRKLGILSLYDNLLPSLPEDIQLPSSLESIDLSGNRLKKIPEELSKLPNLKTLMLGLQTNERLAQSCLTDIPSDLSLKPGLKLKVFLRKLDWRKLRARNAAILMHQGLPWEGELTRDWEKAREN